MDFGYEARRGPRARAMHRGGPALSRQEAGALVLRRARPRWPRPRSSTPTSRRRRSTSPIRSSSRCRRRSPASTASRRRRGRPRRGRCRRAWPSRCTPTTSTSPSTIGGRTLVVAAALVPALAEGDGRRRDAARAARASAAASSRARACRHPWLDRDRADRARRLRDARERHRPGAHRARPRPRGLPDRPALRPRRLRAGRRPRPLHRRGARVAGRSASSTPTRRSSSTCAPSGALLAARGLPRTATRTAGAARTPIIFRATEQWFIGMRRAASRPARARARRDRPRALGPAVGPRPHPRHDRDASRLVPVAPARLGRADRRALLRGVRRRAREPRALRARRGASSSARAPTPGSRARSRSSCRPGSRCASCGGDDVPARDRHPRRLVRLGRQLERGRRAAARSWAAAPTCTSRAATSTAAGSTARC